MKVHSRRIREYEILAYPIVLIAMPISRTRPETGYPLVNRRDSEELSRLRYQTTVRLKKFRAAQKILSTTGDRNLRDRLFSMSLINVKFDNRRK